jgi:murein DD-endopeptidase MepM/ murein hydrolase activator NlpD
MSLSLVRYEPLLIQDSGFPRYKYTIDIQELFVHKMAREVFNEPSDRVNYVEMKSRQPLDRSLRIVAALLLSFAAGVFAPFVRAQQSPQCAVKPASIPLGQTVHLRCESSDEAFATTARLAIGSNARTVRLFKQASGDWQGLLPVAVKDPPGSYAIEFLAADGTTLGSANLTIRKTIFPSQNVTLAPQIEALHSTADEMQTLAAFRDSVSDVKYWDDPLAAPLPGCVISPFGVARLHNGKPTGEFHGGIDQRAAQGTPIRAVAAGVVKISQPFNVLGGTVAIDHGQGLETMYLHMSRLNVSVGAHVHEGDVIGFAGATGRANGPHLHWVVYVNGVPQNPLQWVALRSCAAPKKKS